MKLNTFIVRLWIGKEKRDYPCKNYKEVQKTTDYLMQTYDKPKFTIIEVPLSKDKKNNE